jgi:hypothetical protein
VLDKEGIEGKVGAITASSSSESLLSVGKGWPVKDSSKMMSQELKKVLVALSLQFQACPPGA